MTPTPTYTRRRLLRGVAVAATAGVLATGQAAANRGKPSFGPNIYADGETWGTKGTTALPAPTEHNRQSYDGLYVVTNGAPGQLPVSEAGPGNPAYNGGRWLTHTATWTDAPDPVPVLTRYGPADDPSSVLYHVAAGHLEVTEGTFPGGPMPYFQCPLLPDKQNR